MTSTAAEKITLTRVDGASRRTVEYSVANFIETYSDENSPSSREAARKFAARLLALCQKEISSSTSSRLVARSPKKMAWDG